MDWTLELRSKWLDDLNAGSLGAQEGVVSSALLRAEQYAADRAFHALKQSSAEAAKTVSPSTKVAGIKTMLLKPVGDKCNLGCPYCYEDQRRQSETSSRLDAALTETLLDNVLPFVSKPFHIFVHGGEPLLAGKAYFRDLVERVRCHSHGSEVRFGVQSNATLIDREWAKLLKQLGFSVGVSLDGPPEIHDAQRTGKHGESSYYQVLAGIEHLQSEGVEFGVTSVITEVHARQEDAAQKLFDHFASLGINRFDAHPAYSPFGSSRDWNLSPSLYASFMADLFDSWINYANPEIQIRSFEEFFRAMTGFQAQTCFRSQSCTSIIGVESDGLTTACTRPFAPHYHFGNLLTDSLPQITKGKGYSRFAKDEEQGRESRKDCKWAHLCGHGGCPHERMRDGMQAIDGRHVYCTCDSKGTLSGYPGMFTHFIGRVEAMFTARSNSLESSHRS